MRKQGLRFTENDAGCWIDGAFGTGHALTRVKEMLTDVGSVEAQALVKEIEHDDADYLDEFVGELVEEAIEILYAATDPGLCWLQEAGDLILALEIDLSVEEESP